MSKNPLVDKSFAFSLEIIAFYSEVKQSGFYDVARQVLKSGTSIGANVSEAQNASSKLDFRNKVKIAAKEAEETQYWLRLCLESPLLPGNPALLDRCVELLKIMNKILGTLAKD